MKRNYAIGILFTALAIAGSAQPSPQNSAPGPWQNFLIPDGETVYDNVNHVTWLADGNLAAMSVPGTLNFRFGLPLCPPLTIEPTESCVNMNGSMNYTSALAWVQGMNDANYLGHHDWQLPTTPRKDHGCAEKGPYNNFGFDCKKNALGYLYYEELGFTATETAVPIPPNTVGPFSNFQPNFYWSKTDGIRPPGNIVDFSFASGDQGGSTHADFLYVLPMINGDPFGMPTSPSNELYANSNGTAVYDPEAKVTWLANANLAATWVEDGNGGAIDTLGLPLCATPTTPAPCVALDGSMNYESAMAFINAMNYYGDPISHQVVGYLGHKDWELPKADPSCHSYGCRGEANPMGNLYYDQLNFTAGTPVVPVPDIAVGPFHHLLPFPYWSCLAKTIQDACETAYPAPGFEFGFSFGNGFLGTAAVKANHFVTAYFVGCDLSTCQTITFAPITGTEDALTSLTLSATASSGLAVTFSSTTPNVCTVSGNTASLLFPGKCTIEASQAGDDSWESALPIHRTFTVGQAPPTKPPIPPKCPPGSANCHL